MSDGAEPLDRRAAIRKGVGAAAAAGLVWSAPRIEGLSVRPRYAAASSVTATFNVVFSSSCSGAPSAFILGPTPPSIASGSWIGSTIRAIDADIRVNRSGGSVPGATASANGSGSGDWYAGFIPVTYDSAVVTIHTSCLNID